MADLRGWFATVDADRSGHINSAELQRALAMGSLNFSLALCAQLIRESDVHTFRLSTRSGAWPAIWEQLLSRKKAWRRVGAAAASTDGGRAGGLPLVRTAGMHDRDNSGTIGFDEFQARGPPLPLTLPPPFGPTRPHCFRTKGLAAWPPLCSEALLCSIHY